MNEIRQLKIELFFAVLKKEISVNSEQFLKLVIQIKFLEEHIN